MPHDVDLKARLERAGLTVTEVAGWRERGSSSFFPVGSVHHHTAGPTSGVQPSLGIVINGRSDLPGPLCNVHGPREESLRVNLVAAGRANHAGLGDWSGHSGNSSVYGLEEEHAGTTAEAAPSELRIDRMARVHAAFAWRHFTADEVCQHYEWAPDRKIDFVRAYLDPNDFRRRVAARLRLMENPAPPPAPEPEEDDMPLHLITIDKTPPGRTFLTNWLTKRVITPTEAKVVFFPEPVPPTIKLTEEHVNRIPGG